MSGLDELQSSLGFTFNDPAILGQAFIHTSYTNENPGHQTGDNQTMEFLGDAVLNMVVAEALYHGFPALAEGKLTEIRISMIRQEKLAEKAADIKLGNYLVLGKGEEASGGRSKRNNLADTFEALTAAIFLDRGLDVARQFIMSVFRKELAAVKSGKFTSNFKAMLQELTQAEFKTLPEYEIIESTGPDHDKVFVVSVSLGDVVLAVGSGKTRKTAESEAARIAYIKLSAGQE
ncbi:MAG: ribonuclease III [Chloroflexi bacterium]|nr:ribonuclease III [Chloroflexota bacterium]